MFGAGCAAEDSSPGAASEVLFTPITQAPAQLPEDFQPAHAREAEVGSKLVDARFVASADHNVACDMRPSSFNCGVFSYWENATFGRGEYQNRFAVDSERDSVFDATDMSATAMYGLLNPDDSAPAPEIIDPGEVVKYESSYCEGLEDGLRCWNLSSLTGWTLRKESAEFWTFAL